MKRIIDRLGCCRTRSCCLYSPRSQGILGLLYRDAFSLEGASIYKERRREHLLMKVIGRFVSCFCTSYPPSTLPLPLAYSRFKALVLDVGASVNPPPLAPLAPMPIFFFSGAEKVWRTTQKTARPNSRPRRLVISKAGADIRQGSLTFISY